jgi:hypothetical protein
MMVLPDYCECCGAYLQGMATEHKDGCVIKEIIEEHFPGMTKPKPSYKSEPPQMREP